jgi:hypothetical protein
MLSGMVIEWYHKEVLQQRLAEEELRLSGDELMLSEEELG